MHYNRVKRLPPPRKLDLARVLSGEATFHIRYWQYLKDVIARAKARSNPVHHSGQFVGWHYYANTKCCRISKSDLQLMDCHVANAPRNDMQVIASEAKDLKEILRTNVLRMTGITLFAKQTVKDLTTQRLSVLTTKSTHPLPPHIGRGKKAVAYTLAEVLITLGIIGVVAAMTIPTLMQNYQKKVFATRVHQTFNILSQAVEMAKTDYGDISTWDINSNKNKVCDSYSECMTNANKYYAEKYFIPYLKTNNLGYVKLNHPGIKKRNGKMFLKTDNFRNYYSIQLSNGTLVMFAYNGSGTYDKDGNFLYFTLSAPMIWVDVNGPAEPNMAGRDFFVFTISPGRNAFVTYGFNGSDSFLSSGCSENTDYPYTCATLLQKNNWEMDKNYPW